MKKKYFKFFLLSAFSVISLNSIAQKLIIEESHKNNGLEIGEPNNNIVLLRESALNRINSRSTPCANIVVDYDGVDFFDIFGDPNDAQNAFQLAVDIWESLIDSPVTINITATYEAAASPSNLGSASPAYFRSIPGDSDNILYPAALYEKLIGSSDNGNAADITCNFNSTRTDWFFPTNINDVTPAGKINFTSVVLHELGHGLGIVGFGRTRIGTTGSTQGYIRRGSVGQTLNLGDPNAVWFSIWDKFIDNGNNSVLDLTDPSGALLTAFTTDNLTCSSPIAIAQNGGVKPKTYAPSLFNAGSSYSHWDENTFNGTDTALMTPFLGFNETVYDPGNVTLGFMEDMGWSLCQGTLSSNNFVLENIKISPNPFTETLTINLPAEVSNQEFKVTIVDINGRIVSSSSAANTGEIVVSNLNNLRSALYFLTIESKSSDLKITKKIIKR